MQRTTLRNFCSHIICAAFALLAISVLSACSSSNRTDIENYSTDASADFADMKTYRWDFSGMNQLVPTGGHTPEFNRVVCEHVDLWMNDKGYKRVDKGPADFTLDYRVAVAQEGAAENTDAPSVDNRSEVNNYGLRWTFDKDELPTFKGLQAPKDQTVIYRRGTLHLAAFNTQGQVIWHQSANRILTGRGNEAERRAALRVAVDKMMKRFPEK
jgi:cytochrome c1